MPRANVFVVTALGSQNKIRPRSGEGTNNCVFNESLCQFSNQLVAISTKRPRYLELCPIYFESKLPSNMQFTLAQLQFKIVYQTQICLKPCRSQKSNCKECTDVSGGGQSYFVRQIGQMYRTPSSSVSGIVVTLAKEQSTCHSGITNFWLTILWAKCARLNSINSL